MRGKRQRVVFSRKYKVDRLMCGQIGVNCVGLVVFHLIQNLSFIIQNLEIAAWVDGGYERF